MTEILTERLHLRAFTVADYEAGLLGDDALAAQLGVPVAAKWLDFPDVFHFWLSHVRTDAALLPWMLYGYFDRATGTMVGGGGFKGLPTLEGVVEIGYGLAPAYRGLGLATEAARALAAWAYQQPGVRLVMAHTLPESNASTRVLERAGFAHVGDVIDPEDGPVWRWELAPPVA